MFLLNYMPCFVFALIRLSFSMLVMFIEVGTKWLAANKLIDACDIWIFQLLELLQFAVALIPFKLHRFKDLIYLAFTLRLKINCF